MKVYVIDNGGQWTHREYRVLRDLGAEASTVPNTTPFDKISDAMGLVLSGGAPRIGMNTEKMGRNGEYLEKAECPVLGICAGHQFIALHFGGTVGPAKVPEFGKARLVVDEEDELFRGLPGEFNIWMSHNDEVSSVPKDFDMLAHSDSCKVQAMRHRKWPIFGLQFHPEVEHTEYGHEILRNFLDVCTRKKR